MANLFASELTAARQRIQAQRIQLEMAERDFAEAVRRKLQSTAKMLEAKVKRWKFAVAITEAAIAEMESAVTGQADMVEEIRKRK